MPQALKVLCEILTTDPEGGPARIPVEQFEKLYRFLAHVDGEVASEQIHKVMEYLKNDPALVLPLTDNILYYYFIHIVGQDLMEKLDLEIFCTLAAPDWIPANIILMLFREHTHVTRVRISFMMQCAILSHEQCKLECLVVCDHLHLALLSSNY